MLKNYDLILGQDLLRQLGIDIQFSTKSCSWGEYVIPMKIPQENFDPNFFLIEESGPVKEATTRLRKFWMQNMNLLKLKSYLWQYSPWPRSKISTRKIVEKTWTFVWWVLRSLENKISWHWIKKRCQTFSCQTLSNSKIFGD